MGVDLMGLTFPPYLYYQCSRFNSTTVIIKLFFFLFFGTRSENLFYKTGEFYDLKNDLLEESPLKESELNEVALKERAKLYEALMSFDELEEKRQEKYPPKKVVTDKKKKSEKIL